MTAGDFLSAASEEAGVPLEEARLLLPQLPLQADLTQGHMAAIANALGLRVLASDPASPASDRLARQFLAGMSDQWPARQAAAQDQAGKRRPRSSSPKRPRHTVPWKHPRKTVR